MSIAHGLSHKCHKETMGWKEKCYMKTALKLPGRTYTGEVPCFLPSNFVALEPKLSYLYLSTVIVMQPLSVTFAMYEVRPLMETTSTGFPLTQTSTLLPGQEKMYFA